MAGGYDLREFYARSLVEAFSGLGVFVGKEMEEKENKRVKKKRADGPVKSERLPIKMETD